MKPSDSSDFSDSSEFPESKKDDSIYSFARPSEDGRTRTRYRTVRCPICQTSLAVRENDLGKTFACPDCGTKIAIPSDLPYVETQYEKRHFNEERLRQDRLFSPLRNPNREGIDVDAANVYRLGAAENGTPDPNAARRAFQFRTVSCPLCNTGVSVTRNELGRTVVCSDCGTKYKIPENLDFSQTKIERERFDEEKRRRDVRLSPLRNPNREGIDVDAATYSLDINSDFVEQARKKSRPTSAIYLTDAERAAREEEARQNANAPDSTAAKKTEKALKSENSVDGASETAAPQSKKQTARSKSALDADWLPVRCRVCETLINVPRKHLGKSFHCPDCGTKNVVSAAFQEIKEAADARFAPRERGTYRLDAENSDAAGGGSRRKGTVAPSEFRLRDAFEDAKLRQKNEKRAEIESESAQNDENFSKNRATRQDPGTQPAAQSRTARDAERLRAIDEAQEKKRLKRLKRLKRKEEEERAVAEPRLVLRRQGGQMVWAPPSPPKKFPLFNGTFRPILANELLGRDVWTAALASVLSLIFVTLFVEAFEKGFSRSTFESGLAASEMLINTTAAVMLGAFIGPFASNSFACCYAAGNGGARRILVDDGDVSFIGKELYFLWILTILSVATTIGVAAFGGTSIIIDKIGAVKTATEPDASSDATLKLEKSLNSGEPMTFEGSLDSDELANGAVSQVAGDETATDAPLNSEESKNFSWRWKTAIFVASVWFFFPVFFLSTSQTNLFVCPLTADVARTFFSKWVIWAQFYLTSAVGFAFPVALFLLYWNVKPIWFAFPVAVVLLPELYGLLLGRLSWILEDELRSAEFDD